MEISIQRYISDGGALKIKQADKHLAFLTHFLLMLPTAPLQRCCLHATVKMHTLLLLIHLFGCF